MKKLAFLLAFAGVVCIGIWGAYQLFADSLIVEQRKAAAPSIEIEVPAGDGSEETVTVEVKQYTVNIANSGGSKQMDACTGGFTRMTDYMGLTGKDIVSAHNNCGGDVVLPMVVNDRVVVTENGKDTEYVVTEVRDTHKTVTTDAVNDMNGVILLQTCYYSWVVSDQMKFVALQPVEGGNNGEE